LWAPVLYVGLLLEHVSLGKRSHLKTISSPNLIVSHTVSGLLFRNIPQLPQTHHIHNWAWYLSPKRPAFSSLLPVWSVAPPSTLLPDQSPEHYPWGA
jgi:hypothetical protein